jgi:hypothetical protein
MNPAGDRLWALAKKTFADAVTEEAGAQQSIGRLSHSAV